MTDKIVVFSTCESEDEAVAVARGVVEKKLAACVNILRGARSIYRWKGAIEDAQEFVLMMKSRRDLLPALRAAVAAVHSYEVSELIALPIVDGSEEYLGWLDGELEAKS
jgi:periplasmic divalent cation tolerance protein